MSEQFQSANRPRLFLVRSVNVLPSMTMGHEESGRRRWLGAYLDIRYSSNVILWCQNEFIIDNPIRFMVKACWRMELDNLVVLHRQIMTWFFLKTPVSQGQKKVIEVKRGHLRSKGDLEITNLVGDLHKESRNKSFSNIWIVLFGSEFSTSSWQSKSVHDTWQLLSDIISTELCFSHMASDSVVVLGAIRTRTWRSVDLWHKNERLRR